MSPHQPYLLEWSNDVQAIVTNTFHSTLRPTKVAVLHHVPPEQHLLKRCIVCNNRFFHLHQVVSHEQAGMVCISSDENHESIRARGEEAPSLSYKLTTPEEVMRGDYTLMNGYLHAWMAGCSVYTSTLEHRFKTTSARPCSMAYTGHRHRHRHRRRHHRRQVPAHLGHRIHRLLQIVKYATRICHRHTQLVTMCFPG